MKRYWKFFWPLALMSVALQSGQFVRNYVLLHFEDGVEALALFTLAHSALHPFLASLVFLPQFITIAVGNTTDYRAARRFMVNLMGVLLLPFLVIAWTPVGGGLLSLVYQIPPESMETVRLYLKWFTPLMVTHAAIAFYGGLLVRAGRTGLLTVVKVSQLGLLILNLLIGRRLGTDPVLILCTAWLLADVAALLIAMICYRWRCPPIPRPKAGAKVPSQLSLLSFFWPMAMTSIMFALNRPILFNCITRINPTGDPAGPDVNSIIAALSLSFSFMILFQSLLNQYRHVGATLGRDDPVGARRFLTQLAIGCTVVLVAAEITPLTRWFLEILQGARGAVLENAIIAIAWMTPIPLVIAWRNYYHGLAMARRKTRIMGWAGLNRNIVTAILGIGGLQLGLLNIYAAGMIMTLGFLAEAATVAYGSPKAIVPRSEAPAPHASLKP